MEWILEDLPMQPAQPDSSTKISCAIACVLLPAVVSQCLHRYFVSPTFWLWWVADKKSKPLFFGTTVPVSSGMLVSRL